MTLSLDLPITASDILEIHDLKEGKIFLLKGRSGDSLVLKAEGNVTGEKLKSASPVVKAIDPTIKMKPLTQGEVGQLSQYYRTWRDYLKVLNDYGVTNADVPELQAEIDAVANFKSCIDTFGVVGTTGRTNIAKLSFVRMQTLSSIDDNFVVPPTAQSWSSARDTFAAFIKALNKSGGMEKLGEIVTGDACIGNNDRFSFSGKAQMVKKYHTETTQTKRRLKALQNINNIIIVKERKGKAARPSMLDYMDPFTTFFSDNPSYDYIDAVLDPDSRKQMAKDIAADLAFLLEPEASFFSKTKLGGSKAWTRLDSGMKSGLRKVAKSLKARRNTLAPSVSTILAKLLAAGY